MGWSIGYDDNWKRDVGYGVPAYCDHPKCNEEIHRGLAHVCGADVFGGDRGCGLFFCQTHLSGALCAKCRNRKDPYKMKPDHPDWMQWKLIDESWEQWRKENKDEVNELIVELKKHIDKGWKQSW